MFVEHTVKRGYLGLAVNLGHFIAIFKKPISRTVSFTSRHFYAERVCMVLLYISTKISVNWVSIENYLQRYLCSIFGKKK